MKIIGDILHTTRDEIIDDDGASITYLIKKANISHVKICGILKTLVSQGLLEQVDCSGMSRYRISKSGRDFLQEYQSFRTFVENFGLSI